jgi:hypothetical protein
MMVTTAACLLAAIIVTNRQAEKFQRNRAPLVAVS